MDIPADKGEKILSSLGFLISKKNNDSFEVIVPEYRVDVAQEADISEELARMVGYNEIPSNTQTYFKSEKPLAKVAKCRQQIREILSGSGLLEAYNPSLVSVDLIKSAGVPDGASELDMIELANASTQDQSVMRTLLYPALIKNLKHNISRKSKDVWLYEIGRIYTKSAKAGEFNEEEKVGMVLWGNDVERNWQKNSAETNFFSGTGIIETLIKRLGIKKLEFISAERAGCHPGRTAEVYINKKTNIGWIAELDPKTARELDISGRVVIAELKIAELSMAWQPNRKYQLLPKFPESSRDIAFLFSDEFTHSDVVRAIGNEKINIFESVELFDLYHGEQVPEGKKSMAYRIVYRAADRNINRQRS